MPTVTRTTIDTISGHAASSRMPTTASRFAPDSASAPISTTTATATTTIGPQLCKATAFWCNHMDVILMLFALPFLLAAIVGGISYYMRRRAQDQYGGSTQKKKSFGKFGMGRSSNDPYQEKAGNRSYPPSEGSFTPREQGMPGMQGMNQRSQYDRGDEYDGYNGPPQGYGQQPTYDDRYDY